MPSDRLGGKTDFQQHDSVAFAMPPLGWLLPEKSDVLFMLAEYTDKIFEQFEKMGSSS